MLPAALGKLTKLDFMNFYSTQVSGRFVGRCDWSIVHNYESAPTLLILFFSDPPLSSLSRSARTDYCKGTLPPEIGKLAALTTLRLDDTKVSGRFVGRCDWSIVRNYQSAPTLLTNFLLTPRSLSPPRALLQNRRAATDDGQAHGTETNMAFRDESQR